MRPTSPRQPLLVRRSWSSICNSDSVGTSTTLLPLPHGVLIGKRVNHIDLQLAAGAVAAFCAYDVCLGEDWRHSHISRVEAHHLDAVLVMPVQTPMVCVCRYFYFVTGSVNIPLMAGETAGSHCLCGGARWLRFDSGSCFLRGRMLINAFCVRI